jgi:hypothetical protein
MLFLFEWADGADAAAALARHRHARTGLQESRRDAGVLCLLLVPVTHAMCLCISVCRRGIDICHAAHVHKEVVGPKLEQKRPKLKIYNKKPKQRFRAAELDILRSSSISRGQSNR